jgi:hypothetical protein
MGDGGIDDGWSLADRSGSEHMKPSVNRSFKTKPQYLLPFPTAKEWEAPLIYRRIYQIDYDTSTRNLRTRFLVDSDDRSIKLVAIVTIYGEENHSYRWYRPNLDAIIAEGNFTLLKNLLIQDVLQHI